MAECYLAHLTPPPASVKSVKLNLLTGREDRSLSRFPIQHRKLSHSGRFRLRSGIAVVIRSQTAGSSSETMLFGGYVHYQKPAEDKGFYAGLVKEFPDIDILGVTTPVYAFHGPG